MARWSTTLVILLLASVLTRGADAGEIPSTASTWTSGAPAWWSLTLTQPEAGMEVTVEVTPPLESLASGQVVAAGRSASRIDIMSGDTLLGSMEAFAESARLRLRTTGSEPLVVPVPVAGLSTHFSSTFGACTISYSARATGDPDPRYRITLQTLDDCRADHPEVRIVALAAGDLTRAELSLDATSASMLAREESGASVVLATLDGGEGSAAEVDGPIPVRAGGASVPVDLRVGSASFAFHAASGLVGSFALWDGYGFAAPGTTSATGPEGTRNCPCIYHPGEEPGGAWAFGFTGAAASADAIYLLAADIPGS